MDPNILIVEDEPEVARMLSLGLRRLLAGARIQTARHGGEVVDRLEAGERFDLLITDVMMPIMDGVRLVEALDEADLPGRVLLLSAVPGRELTEVQHSPRVVGYLQKPVDLLVLVQRVREALEG